MLEHGIISIVFNEGLDTKTDEVDVVSTKLLAAENVVFNKNNALSKVDGYKLLSSTIENPQTVYPATSNLLNYSMLTSYKDELLTCAGTGLYGYKPENDSWVYKGTYSNINFDSEDIVYMSGRQKLDNRYAKCGDYELITSYVGFGTQGINYYLLHNGTNILFDQNLTAYTQNLALLKFNNSIWALATAPGSTPYGTKFSFTSGYSIGTGSPYSTFGTQVGSFDYICDENNNICVIAWYDQTAQIIYIAQFNEDGTITHKTTVASGLTNGVADLRLFHSKFESTAHYVVGYVDGNILYTTGTYYSYYKAAVFSTSFVSVVAPTILASSLISASIGGGTYAMLGFPLDFIDIIPDAQYRWKFFYTKVRCIDLNYIDSLKNEVRYITMDSSGTVGTDTLFKTGCTISGKAINDTDAIFSTSGISSISYNNYYLIMSYFISGEYGTTNPSTQPAYFFIDSSSGNQVGKITSMSNSGHRSAILPFNNIFLISYTNLVVNNFINEYGIRKFTANFGELKSKAQVNDTLYLSGPMLYEYDGTYVKENNFLVFPEDVRASSTDTTVAVITQGTPSVKEKSSMTFSTAEYLNVTNNPLTTTHIEFYVPGTHYYIYFIKDHGLSTEIGVSPALSSATGIPVYIDSVMDANAVSYCVFYALKNAGIAIAITFSKGSNTITIENTNVGNVTDISISNLFTGLVPTGSYQYSAIYEWLDKFGSVHRSAPSTPVNLTVVSGPKAVMIAIPYLHLTAKQDAYIKLYRTTNGGSTFYLITQGPIGGNYTSANDTTLKYLLVSDISTDTQISSNEILYTDGGVLENISIDANKDICSFKNRLIASGFASGNKLIYSKPKEENVGMSLNDQSVIETDSLGGDIAAQIVMDEKLIIFKKYNIFYVVGDGANSTGVNESYSVPQLITSDVGCAEANSLILMPLGIMFKSNKGIYILDRSLQPQYIGWEVEKYNSMVITSATLLEDHNQVRFTTQDGMCLVYDYFVKQWSTLTGHQAIDSCIWNGLYCHLDNDGVRIETRGVFEYNGVGYPLNAETAWIKLDGVQNFQRVYRANILAKYKTPHILYIRVFYDYDSNNYDEYSFNTNNIDTVMPISQDAGVYQIQMHLKRQKCQAIKFKFFDNALDEGLSLTDLTLIIGKKRGINKVPANKKI